MQAIHLWNCRNPSSANPSFETDKLHKQANNITTLYHCPALAPHLHNTSVKLSSVSICHQHSTALSNSNIATSTSTTKHERGSLSSIAASLISSNFSLCSSKAASLFTAFRSRSSFFPHRSQIKINGDFKSIAGDLLGEIHSVEIATESPKENPRIYISKVIRLFESKYSDSFSELFSRTVRALDTFLVFHSQSLALLL